MFTLKFYKHFYTDPIEDKDESSDTRLEALVSKKVTALSGESYDVFERANGSVVITVYKSLQRNNNEAVEMNLSHDLKDVPSSSIIYYENCYIENMAGKTIAKILPQDGAIKMASRF